MKKKIILARDRSGEKPLYISSNNNFFSFSSDLISLMKLPNFEKKYMLEFITSFY